ncbi:MULTISPECIES: hypothetical protein [Methylobacterium]|jgi:hypothetical protein|uniref:Porin n=2 Tax=Methylobacterium TaxID=407 RepID=A0A509EKC0_9HYPH|nr:MULTISPECIES: hypothetical protein [Methylobacterium]MBP29135.1 hypothetical protein [Methylobacterium sp.]GJD56301.1 hypothetical protein IFDJLNFL_2196 [Methylobacterium dankookense]VUD74608.1 hypothetical protein MET9862_05241 [Methylobacterium symbioticum]VUF13670.1 hypothetical protein MTDSW087_03377 [Methylobacterium dankookense]
MPSPHRPSPRLGALIASITIAAPLSAPLPARAQSVAEMAARMDAMQRQMQAMQQELAALRRQAGTQRAALAGETRERRVLSREQTRLAARTEHQQRVAQVGGPGGARPAVSARAPVILANDLVCNAGSYALGPAICFTPGGFVELAGIFRNPNVVSDVATDFNGIPFRNGPRSRESEFRFSARQSRLSGLFTAKVEPTLQISGYYEIDFLAAGTTSNSRESNSYTPRIRQIFASVDALDTGWHVLAGQAWSLITTDLSGITPLKEQIPLTIDAQYVPGFNWTRNPQVRVVKDIAPGLWAGLSAESPQSVLPPSPFAAPSLVNVNNTGDAAGLLNNATTYSNNSAPDIIGKLALEPGFGHFELKGLVRFFDDRLSPTNLTAAVRLPGRSDTALGYGIGGAATVPVIDKRLDLQVSGLVGQGIGRYGSAQLPDFALKADGSIAPLPTFQLLAGAVAHVQPGTDVYVYAGWEHVARAGAFDTTGYGSPTLVVTGCDVEGAASGTCQAESRDIRQITGGFWHDLYKGSYGRLVAGAQVSYTERDAFQGASGVQPSNHLVTGLTSLRYYPF